MKIITSERKEARGTAARQHLAVRVSRHILTILWLALPALSGCAPSSDPGADTDQVIAAFTETHAIDGRLTVFDISWKLQSNQQLLIEGEMEDGALRQQLLAEIRRSTSLEVVDQLRLLPDDSIGSATYGIVSVSVGNVRSQPRHPAQLATQVLMGTPMRLLREQNGWFLVQGPDGYLGWLESSALQLVDDAGLATWRAGPLAIVTSLFAQIHSAPDDGSDVLSDAVLGDRLQADQPGRIWTRVTLPDQTVGFLRSDSLVAADDWKASRHLDADSILATARQFLGIPYLWGGTSARGFDCSGFAKTVFALNGLNLLRDADQQARMGAPVEVGSDFGGLKAGDLLFFGQAAEEGKPERISHVAIYTGDGHYIHATPGRLRINSLLKDSPDFNAGNLRRFLRARRLL